MNHPEFEPPLYTTSYLVKFHAPDGSRGDGPRISRLVLIRIMIVKVFIEFKFELVLDHEPVKAGGKQAPVLCTTNAFHVLEQSQPINFKMDTVKGAIQGANFLQNFKHSKLQKSFFFT